MAKKKKKTNKTNKPKKKTKKIELSSLLNRVYTNAVNLETKCKHRCECCKVAMPQLNYCEAVQILKDLWEKNTDNPKAKIDMICKSIEYFFKSDFDKFDMETLIKPCMLLDKNGMCKVYTNRPLSCRMYGLWPEKDYKERVDKFEDAYKDKLKREELPLNTQCPHVKRVDGSVPITTELIETLYKELNDIDDKIGKFTELQMEHKENYRTLHDWILFFFFGEQWLTELTNFLLSAGRDEIEDLLVQVKKQVENAFKDNVPDLKFGD